MDDFDGSGAIVASRKHLVAVNRAIRAAELDETGLDAPLVEILRDLARKIDRCGPDGPSASLMAAYLSAQKDLRRTVSVRAPRVRPEKPASTPGEGASEGSRPPLHAVEESKLAKFRKQHRSAG